MILSKFTMATRLGNTPWARRKKIFLFVSHIKKVRGVAIFEQRVRKDAYTRGDSSPSWESVFKQPVSIFSMYTAT